MVIPELSDGISGISAYGILFDGLFFIDTVVIFIFDRILSVSGGRGENSFCPLERDFAIELDWVSCAGNLCHSSACDLWGVMGDI